MGAGTIIAWTDNTFNIAWGCTKISEGCAHCYAERLSRQFTHPIFGWPGIWGNHADRRIMSDTYWEKPLAWNREAERRRQPIKVFSSSMCDIFDDHPIIIKQRKRLWDLIRRTPWLTWQLLTKRAEQIKYGLPDDWEIGYPNVWLGVSIENMNHADRADILRITPAAIRFISYEPALGSLKKLDLIDIDWVIYGGESGPNFRDHDPVWPLEMKDKCEQADVAFFFKQSAAIRTEMGIHLKGELIREFPVQKSTGYTLLNL